MESERMKKLKAMVQTSPEDTFLLYGIALEYRKAGQLDEAVEYLQRVIDLDPGYCYAYHQRGLAYEVMGDLDAARQAYREGMAAAEKKGDAHAREEIAAALAMMDNG